MKIFAAESAWILHGFDADDGFKISVETIAWILRGLDDGVAYGGPIVVVANLAIGTDMIADVCGVFSTRPFDDEMRMAIKAACYELGAIEVRGLNKEPHGIFIATVTIGQGKIADVRAILTTQTYDAEMSEVIKRACAKLGAKQIHMVRWKNGVEQPPVLLSLGPKARP